MNKNNREEYYENTNFAELLKMQKGRKVCIAAKRITLNISDRIYDEANELDQYMRMGYQNVLKAAMTIGLTELFDHVSHHKMQNKSKTRLPSWQTYKKQMTRKLSAAKRSIQPT
jgi:hypothetical protein